MRWTQTYIPTLRETPTEAEIVSHRLMLRAGLIRKLSSGTYSYLPLGMRSLLKVIGVIRREMDRAGALEVLMPALQPAEIWKRSGRDKLMGPEMIRFRDRHGKEMVLGPTHEEVITQLVSGEVRSYRDLPKNLYQIQVKFRDEPRPRFGVIRSCEFLMKDAYSFDRDESGLKASYQKMVDAYRRIFACCGLEAIPVEAETGFMGGEDSHEFMVPAESGEDTIVRCSSCSYSASLDKHLKNIKPDAAADIPRPKEGGPCPKCGKPVRMLSAIEVGHIFKLGTKYSAGLSATFLDEDGKQKPFVMGCYGIGVTRILAAVVETHADPSGILWPISVAPYAAVIVPINLADSSTRSAAESLYQQLTQAGVDTLFDDREVSGGVKLKDADLIGFPVSILLSEKTLQQSSIELKLRWEGQSSLVPQGQVVSAVKKLLDNPSFSSDNTLL